MEGVMSKAGSRAKQSEGMCLVLPTDLKNKLRKRAQRDRRSMTKTIQVALELFLCQPPDARQEQNNQHETDF